ncbi:MULTISPECIES: acyl carrier protein [Ectothiorhodospira]|uniref:acyl carrier protein n=1 Tax=Ectothiorhodospira TaxID=1051 RepID=UPI0019060203|nr:MULTISPECIES: acyl carrier protein [Ectothiorhodospira]MBK1672755.1 acyl carrier protein [Ectothiorhodospira shaposhnikovii]MCG5510338.1 acyl carrier protein [Ectothiorhodospira lacustris]MCG5522084.1 acyl carrier protein [Ectothiorhodospira lacustris]
MSSSTIDQIKNLLDSLLGLNGRAASFDESTALLGNVPELDSMAVVTIITSLEEQFGIMVDDDEISAETFETLGSLTEFVDRKLAEA